MGSVPVHAAIVVSPCPDATMSARFASSPVRWLPPPSRRLGRDIEVVLTAGDLLPIRGVTALARVGPLDLVGPRLAVRSLCWRARDHVDRFPVMVGDLELHDQRELRLVGAYEPPWATVGSVTNRLLGRHLARRVVQTFTVVVARRLSGIAPHDPEVCHHGGSRIA